MFDLIFNVFACIVMLLYQAFTLLVTQRKLLNTASDEDLFNNQVLHNNI